MKTLLIFFLFTFIFIGNKAIGQHSLGQFKALENFELQKGYMYALLNANDDYIVIMEFMTGTIEIYNLNTKNSKSINLIQGRGPNEFGMITSILLKQDNTMLLNDAGNKKILVIDIETKKYIDEIVLHELSIHRADLYNEKLFILNTGSQESIFHKIDLNNNQIYPIDMGEYSIDNFFTPFIKREGYLKVNDNQGIFVLRYYPEIYVVDLSKNKTVDKIEFDKVGEITLQGSPSGNNMIYRAPTSDEVDVLVKDFTTINGQKDFIYFLAEGKGDYESYKKNKIYKLNLSEPESITSYDIGINGDFITSNSEYLFVFSNDEGKVFKYQLNSN